MGCRARARRKRLNDRSFVSAPRPTYTTGERWILSDGVYGLVRAEKGIYIFAAAPGREIHLSRDLALVKIVRDGRDEWEFWPPYDIPWPLEVGR